MKLLCIGDLHITLDSIEFIGQIFTSYIKNVIQCERVDTIIILGDVLNNDEMAINVREMDCAHQLFKDLSQNIPLYIIVGNHDYIDCHQFLTDRHWMNFLKGTPNVTVVDHVCAVGGAVLVPYVPPGRFQEALNTYPNWKSASVICAHQSFNGAHWKSGICLNGDDWSTDLPPIISGHIHGCQKLDTGVWYPGSIEPTKLNHLAVVEFQEGDSAAIRLIKHFGARAFIGTVEEILKVGNLTNCDITIRDTRENVARLKRLPLFVELEGQNTLRIMSQTIPFLELYRQNIFDTGDVYTYCAAEKVLANFEQVEDQLLFIPLQQK